MSDLERKRIAIEEDRRNFLRSCGRFAGTVPPAMVVMLSTSMHSDAIAKSGHNNKKGNNGFGNGPDTTNPGSFHGGGVSSGGPGNGQSQSSSKGQTKLR